MGNRRKRKILINEQENNLLSNSIVIERYPELKNILNKYKTLYEKDMKNNDDFDDKLKNQILYVFNDIVNKAVEEWRGSGKMDLADGKKVYCSLCGRDNKYIFYIKNIYTEKVLNVGSECIDKFPKLRTGLPDGMTAKQYKSKQIRGYKKLRQIEIFNERFPNAKNMLKSWNKEYKGLPIILPVDIHNNINNIHKKADKIYKGFVNGVVAEKNLNKFEDLINKRQKSILKAQEFINKNKDNEFICTKEIYDWIFKRYPKDANNLIEDVRNNSSILTSDIIPFVYEKNFIERILYIFKNMFLESNLSILRIENNNVYFRFNDKKQRLKCELYMTRQRIMQLYGKKLIIDNYQISERDILNELKLVPTINNYNLIKGEIEKILKNTDYRIELDNDSIKYGLEFINIRKKEFASNLSTEIFFNNHKNIILLKEKNPAEYLSRIISKINKWRPLSDKKKYDIGDISK